MTAIELEHTHFVEDGDGVKGVFYTHFEFKLSKEELSRMDSTYTVKDGALIFDSDDNKVERRAYQLIENKMSQLRSRLSGKPAVYIDDTSGIPLIGSLSFGLIDRDTNCIEIRPNTSCNLSCLFCSVGEGKKSFNTTEYLVEADYLVSGLKELVAFKDCEVDVHIGCQGEPTLYARLEELISKIRAIPKMRNISMVTNGVLLDEKKVKALADAGLTQLDLSINALSEDTATALAGCTFPLERVKRVAAEAAKHLKLVISPVWVPGMNDNELDELILLTKKLNARIGIQNYLPYKYGRNPVKPVSMTEFEKKLVALQITHNVQLLMGPDDFSIVPTKKLPKPFKRGDVVEGNIIAPGRHPGEKLIVAGNRVVTVSGCRQESGKVKGRITRSKHNIFYAKRISKYRGARIT